MLRVASFHFMSGRESAHSSQEIVEWNTTTNKMHRLARLCFASCTFFAVYLSSSSAAVALFWFCSVVHYIVVVAIIIFVCSFVIFSNYLCSSSESWILCVQQTWTFMHNKLKMSRQNMLLKNTWKYTHQTQSPDYNTMHILLLGFFFLHSCVGKRSKKNFIFSTKSRYPFLVCSFIFLFYSTFMYAVGCCQRHRSSTLFGSFHRHRLVLLSTHTQTIWFRICIFRMHFNALVSDLIIKFVQRNGIFEKINEPEISIAISSSDVTCKILSGNIILCSV